MSIVFKTVYNNPLTGSIEALVAIAIEAGIASTLKHTRSLLHTSTISMAIVQQTAVIGTD